MLEFRKSVPRIRSPSSVNNTTCASMSDCRIHKESGQATHVTITASRITISMLALEDPTFKLHNEGTRLTDSAQELMIVGVSLVKRLDKPEKSLLGPGKPSISS
jgi:hypothetical protein